MGSLVKTLKSNIDCLQSKDVDFRIEIDAINDIYHALSHLSKKQCKQLKAVANIPKYRDHILKVVEAHEEMTKETKVAINEALLKDEI